MKIPGRKIILTLMLTIGISGQLRAQGTAFTYQGRLNDGANPANGIYNLQFTVFDAVTNGTQIAAPITNSAVTVTGGIFTVILNFGSSPFAGNPRWLELAVQTNNAVNFTTLTPRQPLTAVPYAIMAGSASNLLGTVPASQLNGTIGLGQLPGSVVTNGGTGISLAGAFGGIFYGTLADLNSQIPTTLSNINSQVATAINLAGGTNFNASQITAGTWTNASINYSYKSFSTNYTVTSSDVVLNCTGTNQIITLLPANSYPPSTLLTIWSDNLNGSVIVTNGTGYESITVPGVGRGLSVVLGPANSPSNCITLMVHGGHW